MKLINWIKNLFKKKEDKELPNNNLQGNWRKWSGAAQATRPTEDYSAQRDMTEEEFACVMIDAANTSSSYDTSPSESWSGDGGTFNGGGASGDWGSSDSSSSDCSSSSDSGSSGDSGSCGGSD